MLNPEKASFFCFFFFILPITRETVQIVTPQWQAKRWKAVWEHQNGMMCWPDCTNCGCLWVNLCMCVHMCLTVFGFLFFLSWCVCAYVVVLENEKQKTVTSTQMHPDCDTWLHILMTSSFYWTINRWRLGWWWGGGGYAAALLIADRSDLHPLLHHPRSWLHGVTSSPLFMMLSAWPTNKRAAACSVIREDWNQLLTLTVQHDAVLLVLFKCDGCKIKYIRGGKKGYYMFLLSTALADPPSPNIPLCY